MNGIEVMNAGRRTSRAAVVVTAMAILALTACGPAKVNWDVLMNVKKVGILTVVIDKVGAQPTDDEVIQATVNYATGLYADALARRTEWRLVPFSAYRENPEFRNLLSPGAGGRAKAAQKPANAEGEGSGLKSAFSKFAMRLAESASGGSLEESVSKESKRYLAGPGMPVIPYVNIGPVINETTTKGNMTIERTVQGNYREELFVKIGALAGKLNLDGFIVLYLHTGIRSTVGATVIGGDRGNDTIRMVPTMILVSKDGKAAIDMGTPVMDAIATSNMAVPLYKKEYDAGGKHKDRDGRRFSLVIDLQDPKGKVKKDFFELTDDALKDFMKGLDKALTKK